MANLLSAPQTNRRNNRNLAANPPSSCHKTTQNLDIPIPWATPALRRSLHPENTYPSRVPTRDPRRPDCHDQQGTRVFSRRPHNPSPAGYSDLSSDAGILELPSSSGIDLSKSVDLSDSPGTTLSFSSTSPTVHSTNSSITWKSFRGGSGPRDI